MKLLREQQVTYYQPDGTQTTIDYTDMSYFKWQEYQQGLDSWPFPLYPLPKSPQERARAMAALSRAIKRIDELMKK